MIVGVQRRRPRLGPRGASHGRGGSGRGQERILIRNVVIVVIVVVVGDEEGQRIGRRMGDDGIGGG